MGVDPDDALRRYGHVRLNLAALDAKIEAIDLKAHCSGHGAPLDADAVQEAQELLRELGEACRTLADAAEGLAGAVGGGS